MSRPASSTLVALTSFAILALVASTTVAAAPNANNLDAPLTVYTGSVVGNDGEPIRGATVSLFSTDEQRSISVYSQPDGTYKLPAVPAGKYKLRVRLMGWLDEWKDLKETTEPTPIQVRLRQAEGWALQSQRPAHDLMNMLEWEDEADALNFKMMCAYCHQVGTVGFRSPEEPVDWEVMLTRMDGFQGLYKHTQDVLVNKIVDVYGRDAEENWTDFDPPESPSGESLKGEVREWLMGDQAGAVIHDLELGDDGLVYTVDMAQDVIETLDPATGERAFYTVPGGKDYLSPSSPTTGIHSIEKAEDGNMWVTLAYSGQMGEFDVETKGMAARLRPYRSASARRLPAHPALRAGRDPLVDRRGQPERRRCHVARPGDLGRRAVGSHRVQAADQGPGPGRRRARRVPRRDPVRHRRGAERPCLLQQAEWPARRPDPSAARRRRFRADRRVAAAGPRPAPSARGPRRHRLGAGLGFG